MNFLLFLTLPCAFIFFIQSETIVQILFGRGEFDKTAVLQTAMVLRIYTVVLVFSSLSRVLSSCFFAINKNWFMVIGAILFVACHFLLAQFLTPVYGLKGLVGATALSSVLYFFVLTVCLLYLIGKIDFKPLIVLILNTAPGLLVLSLCLVFIPFLFNHFYCALFNVFVTDSCHLQTKSVFESVSSFFNSSYIFSFSYIQSNSLISFFVFVFSCSLGGFLYLWLGQLFKITMAEECLNLFKRTFKFK